MKKALLWSLAVLAFVGAIGGAATGYFFWRFAAHIPPVDYPPPGDAKEARLQDLDYLRRLPEVDRSFSEEERTAFERRLDALEDEIETLNEPAFLMELAGAIAITENGHTSASRRFIFEKMNSLPLRFYWFADGLFVVRARAEQADLIGHKVLRYAGVEPSALVDRLDPYFSGNAAFLRHNSASFLSSPLALEAIGAIGSSESVTLELEGPNGQKSLRTLSVEEEPTVKLPLSRTPLACGHKREEESGHDWRFLPSEPIEATWFGRNPDRSLWSEKLENGGIYWRMRDIFGDEGVPPSKWFENEAAKLRGKPAEYLVIDLRANLGGNYLEAVDVMSEIGTLVAEDGRIYVLTDGATFSAGVVTAALALHGGGEKAVMVGEAMGDDGQFWAEGTGPMVLPNSKMPIFVATGYHDWENGCESFARCFWPNALYGVGAGALEIDMRAPLRFSDYSAGIDTGMQVIFAAEHKR